MELRKVKGLWSYYKEGGIYEALHRLSAYGYLPKRALFLSTRHILVLNKLNAAAGRRPVTGYEFLTADRSCLDELVACQGGVTDTPYEVLQQFFERDDAACYVVRRDGRLIAYFWLFRGSYLVTFDEKQDKGVEFLLNANEAFFGNGFIAPDFRMRGLFPSLVKFIVERQPSTLRFYSSVDSINTHSLRAHARCGFQTAFSIFCSDVFSLRFVSSDQGPGSSARFIGRAPFSLTLADRLPGGFRLDAA